MRIIFTFSLILINHFLFAQNYSCFVLGKTQYFINSEAYLRAMRIDSVKQNGILTIYYPFHTYRFGRDINGRETPIDSAGSSWLGKNVIATQDGIFTFDNMWDTVFINTQAIAGDSWTLYNDTSDDYYIAKVTAIDTMTVGNVLDSVKAIIVNAYNASGRNIADPMDGIKISLSKHNGFVQVFDLYTFPMHKPGSPSAFGLDYYLDYSSNSTGIPSINNQTFIQVAFHNPTRQELYDYEKGDMLQYYGVIGSEYNITYTYIDSIVDKTINANSTSYVISTKKNEVNHSPYKSTTSKNITTMTFDNTPLITDALLPEETSQEAVYYYFPEDTSNCIKSPLLHIGYANLYSFEPCGSGYSYKLKLGRIDFAHCTDPAGVGDYEWLTGSRKNGKPCNAIAQGFDEIDNNVTISVYPNPANDNLYIAFKGIDPQAYTIRLFDIAGKTILITTANQNINITTSELANGLYLLQVMNEAGNSQYEKVIVQH